MGLFKTIHVIRSGGLLQFMAFRCFLHLAQSLSLSASTPLYMILLGSAILAAPVGMLGFMITSALIHWTGRWLGGVGSFLQIRAAVAWSNVTNLGTGLLWLVLVGAFGWQVFFKTFPRSPFTGASLAVVGIVFILRTVLSIWSFVLLFSVSGRSPKVFGLESHCQHHIALCNRNCRALGNFRLRMLGSRNEKLKRDTWINHSLKT